MSNNILDAMDKRKEPRTCPECGYRFPLLLFIKRFAMKFGFSKWTCPSCQKNIKYNYTKTNLIWGAAFLFFIFLSEGLQLMFGWDFPNFVFLIPYLIFILIRLNLATFEKYE